MTRQITVKPLPLREPSHASGNDAIEYSRQYNRLHGSPVERAVVGRRVTRVAFSDEVLLLGVDGAPSVKLEINGDKVTLTLTEGEQLSMAANATERVRLSFPSFDVPWDRAAIANAMTERALEGIFVTPDRVFVYLSEVGIIAVGVLLNADTRKPFLYWDHSE
jgi:hypothetical protein